MIDALHRLDFDIGLLVTRNVDVGEDEECLRAIGDVKAAVEAHRLDAAFLASGLVERVSERYGLVIDLVREM